MAQTPFDEAIDAAYEKWMAGNCHDRECGCVTEYIKRELSNPASEEMIEMAQNRTFEEWRKTGDPDDACGAWHSRDAEVADLQRELAICQEVSDRHLKDAVSLQARIDSVADLKKDISSLRDAIADASKEMTHQQDRIDRVRALAEDFQLRRRGHLGPGGALASANFGTCADELFRALEGKNGTGK